MTLAGTNAHRRNKAQAKARVSMACAPAALLLLPLALSSLCAQENVTRNAPTAPPRVQVAILAFENETNDPNLAHWGYAASLLRRELRQVQALQVLPEEMISRAVQKVRARAGNHLDPNLVREVGERIEAQRIVWGSYSRQGRDWSVEVQVMNVATGDVSTRLAARGDNWFQICDGLALRILAHLHLVPSEKETADMAQRWIHSSEALDWYFRARACHEQSKPLTEQEACLRRAAALDPNSVAILVPLATGLANQGKDAEAQAVASQARRLDPDRADVHSLFAFVHFRRGENAQARDEIREACRLDPENSDYLGDWARYRMSDGGDTEAIGHLERAIQLDPTDAQFHALLALVYVRQDLGGQAVRELKEAERLEAQGTALMNVELLASTVYRQLNDRAAALEHCERYIALSKKISRPPQDYAEYEKIATELRASLIPTFIDAPEPQRYTPEALDRVLKEKLRPEELRLVARPLRWNQQMQDWARELTRDARTDLDKAKALSERLSGRLDGGRYVRWYTAEDVFHAWNDPELRIDCLGHALLFAALARAVEVDAFFVVVHQDSAGDLTSHACAAVFADGRALLVDTRQRRFGAPHRQYEILNDVEAIADLCFQRSYDSSAGPQLIRTGVKLWPDCLCGQLSLIGVLCDEGQWDEAKRLLGSLPEPQDKGVDTAVYWNLRGRLAFYEKNLPQAEKYLLHSISIYAEIPVAHALLGAVYARQLRLTQAREEFRICLRCNPSAKTVGFARRFLALIENAGRFDPASEPAQTRQKAQ